MEAIVVPGHSRRGRVSRRCRRLVDSAAVLADRRQPAFVVFTGGRGGEAEQMRAAWRGRTDVELLVEPTAATTAQNASRTLPLLRERGVTEATVVCAPLHLPRVRYLFGGVYRRAGMPLPRPRRTGASDPVGARVGARGRVRRPPPAARCDGRGRRR